VPGTKRLKLKYYRLLSNFAFIFNLRRYAVLTNRRRNDHTRITCGGTGAVAFRTWVRV